MEGYLQKFGTFVDVENIALDPMAYHAEQFLAAQPPIKLAPETPANPCKALILYGYDGAFLPNNEIAGSWLEAEFGAAVSGARAPVSEDAPDRLSDAPNTPASPVLAACPF
jgi:hypothetical protein